MKIIAALLCIGFSVNSFSSALPEFPFTTVTEESIRKVTPDNVMLTFNVTSFDKEATTAKMILNQSASRAISIFAKYKVPSKIHIMEAKLPRNPAGKLLRNQLKKLYCQ